MNVGEALEIVGVSDTGRVRDHNEDSYASDQALGLIVLADGMGGYRAGEVASAVAVTRVFRDTRDGLISLIPGQVDQESGLRYESLVVQDAIQRANSEVYSVAREHSEYNGMGTTVVTALFYDNHLTCAHVGDSRMYLYRDDRMEQLTVDHTVVQEFIQTGMYSETEAKASFGSNLVTRALGVEEQIDVDIYEQEVSPGDLYLICSDGLTNMVNESKIAKVLSKQQDLDTYAKRLTQLANKGGGEDNISIVLVKVNSPFKAEEDWQHQMLDWFNR
ncbi:MAG: Stp1/IreP family PP2C-type Ser/Thr phosphatase [Arenicellales bacterium]|nr:Stp1/IreP family PP2C-type Ser/Thr phosphatase [Arenicellales bacterium]